MSIENGRFIKKKNNKNEKLCRTRNFIYLFFFSLGRKDKTKLFPTRLLVALGTGRGQI
jgi:hypothetical protein